MISMNEWSFLIDFFNFSHCDRFPLNDTMQIFEKRTVIRWTFRKYAEWFIVKKTSIVFIFFIEILCTSIQYL